ncbi:MAG: V-type ATP synthase subunit E [Candidatus Brockarchaeota archaeon]|nr:V-type ATP synthase subunit E [Candidatus Brockarchaeota archaeon]
MSSLNIPTVSKPSENISRRILEHAEELKEKMLHEARKNAEEIVVNARKMQMLRKRKLIQQGLEDLEKFKEQELTKIRMEYRKKLYEHLWRLIDSIMSAATPIIEGIREQGESYETFLSEIMANAINMIDGKEIILHIDKRDEEIVKNLVKLHSGRRFRIIPDLTTMGGLIIMSEDGHQEVDETIETRLKLRDKTVREELYNLLFGGLIARDW